MPSLRSARFAPFAACALLAFSAPTAAVRAQESPDPDALIDELEGQLGELIGRDDASGRLRFLPEIREAFPPDFALLRAEMFLDQLLVEGEDGKLVFRDKNVIKQNLPMVQRFLKPGDLAKLKGFKDLSPEERKKVVAEILERPNVVQPPKERPHGASPPRAHSDGSSPDAEDEPGQPRPVAEPRPAPRASGDDKELMRRVLVMERRLSQLEDELELEKTRRRAIEEVLEDNNRTLERLRSSGTLEEPSGPLGELRQRARRWRRGLVRLGDLLQREDIDILRRALRDLRGQLEPGDLRDREALLDKAQGALEPDDLSRLFEVFSEFMASPEGRDLIDEVEQTVERLEELVNSRDGDRLGRTLDRFGAERLRRRLQDLIQGRDRDRDRDRDRRDAEPRRERAPERRSEERRDRQERPRGPRGSRLY